MQRKQPPRPYARGNKSLRQQIAYKRREKIGGYEMYRDITMKEISEQHIGQILQVAGWVENIRDHGGVSFIDLRDMYEKYNALKWHYKGDVCFHRRTCGKER